ncbi:MAG TPA: acetyl-CoA carboxylase biotin carboxyl carrier protein subunit [Bacteroidales bacterium]|nr:acetyl-CoA carboxylase biotin carboxyl carrier protein subunit [Bacteroidales bacterium]
MKLTTKRKEKKAAKVTSTPEVAAEQFDILVTEEGEYKTRLSKKYLNRKNYAPLNIKHVISAIPGTITKLFVAENAEVAEGDVLLELEAMKMHNKILAPMSGIVKTIHVKEGERVPKSTLMVEFE